VSTISSSFTVLSFSFLLSIYCDYRNKDNGFSAENQRNPPIQLSKLVLHTFKKERRFS